ncbi:MAG: hypothetical protein K9G62_04235, partial [Alphaproteobacteria bacterium]|nr:hypothetical protein [Alphaproteobacteria bacterium]
MSARSFLSSLAVATALTSVIHVHEAWAQKGVFLSPQTDWAVTRAYGQGQNAGGYCALARRYEQNTILTLAQNSSEEMSLALDFQRPKFDASSNVRVVLDPGAGQQREYSIRPVSEKALVVRLGRDAAFFQALRKTGYLRAEIGNQIFSFNMADIDIGNSELVSCVAAMTQQTPVAEVEVGTPPTFNVAESQLRTEIETLKDQIARLQADNRNISATLKKGVAQAPASAAPATPDPESELKIKALTEENASLQAMLEEAKKGSPSDDQLAAKIAELEVVRAENESLKKATATDPAMSEKLAELEKIRTENESLKKTLAEKETATTSEDLQAQIETLRSANETLKRDLSDAQKAQQSSAQSAADAQKSQKELEDLRKQLSVVQLENEALKLSLQTREGAEQKASAQTEAMAKLQAENQTLKAEIETLKAKIPPEDLKEKINAIEGERKALSDGMRNAELRLETLQSSLSA